MWNKKKILGIIIAVTGVLFARIEMFVKIEKTILFSLNAFGMVLALAGIAIYASGMPRTVKMAKACPFCYAKNAATANICKQCRNKFPEKER